MFVNVCARVCLSVCKLHCTRVNARTNVVLLLPSQAASLPVSWSLPLSSLVAVAQSLAVTVAWVLAAEQE